MDLAYCFWTIVHCLFTDQFLSPDETIFSRDKTIFLRDITSMSHWELCYTMTGKQVDAKIDAFLD